MNIFEYAVIRAVPRVDREEFLNIGVVVFCKNKNFLQMKYNLDRISMFSLDLDNHLESFERICNGHGDGPISILDTPSRFRWLTATRSTIIQTSKVHPGLCVDLELTLDKLFKDLVE